MLRHLKVNVSFKNVHCYQPASRQKGSNVFFKIAHYEGDPAGTKEVLFPLLCRSFWMISVMRSEMVAECLIGCILYAFNYYDFVTDLRLIIPNSNGSTTACRSPWTIYQTPNDVKSIQTIQCILLCNHCWHPSFVRLGRQYNALLVAFIVRDNCMGITKVSLRQIQGRFGGQRWCSMDTWMLRVCIHDNQPVCAHVIHHIISVNSTPSPAACTHW